MDQDAKYALPVANHANIRYVYKLQYLIQGQQGRLSSGWWDQVGAESKGAKVGAESH